MNGEGLRIMQAILIRKMTVYMDCGAAYYYPYLQFTVMLINYTLTKYFSCLNQAIQQGFNKGPVRL